jgi:mannose-6-phosphate isomerase-like protein (cupin superfamily)
MRDEAWVLRDLNVVKWERGIGPGIVDKKIIGPKDSNTMLMSVARMDPGVKSPPHRHKYLQVFYFLEGRGKLYVDGEEMDVGPGSVARFIKGEEHSVYNPGPGTLTLLEVRVLPRGSEEWE